MTQQTKSFPLRSLLTVTTGRLLTTPVGPRDNGIGQLHEILEWICGEAPFTHSLPRFAEEAKPWLCKCFPELGLAEAAIPSLEKWMSKDRSDDRQEGIKMWLTELKMMHPRIKDAYDVEPMPSHGHTEIDPMEELAVMVGDKTRIIAIEVPEKD